MTVLFAGNEDLDFQYLGQGTPVFADSGIRLDATAGRFRAGYARYAITFDQHNQNNGWPINSVYARAVFGNTTQFWFSGRIVVNNAGVNPGAIGLRFRGPGMIERIRLTNTGTLAAGPYSVSTVNAAGTVVSLGNTSAGFTVGPTDPDKLDVFINYAVAGSILVYINKTLIFSFVGDVTTDGATQLQLADFGAFCYVTSFAGSGEYTAWSEVIVSTTDTRDLSLVTQVPTANGNTHNWDAGTAANIAATSLATGDATPNYALSAGLIQEYQVTPALPGGFFSVVSVIHKARLAASAAPPQNVQFMVRVAGADFTSGSVSPGLSYGTISNNWDLNPATSAVWQVADLPDTSASYNMGLKSIT